MPTFRRILKFTPAVVMGLLVVVWVVSLFRQIFLAVNFGQFNLNTAIDSGSLNVYSDHVGGGHYFSIEDEAGKHIWGWPLGALHFRPDGLIGDVVVPISLISTALLPLAIGTFNAFRFRLWHYLAYTALVAAELAYYLRWQE
jgi:hypothetical protein